ncbi:ABC transporter ATP-binding protein [Candidatus Saccharibacteria bacterium]|nr:ABC transporter ATP-binding protein [Candidatus Saccharibacteria bacterium]
MNLNVQTIKQYWRQSRKYKASFIVMLICIPLGVVSIDMALPYFLSHAVGGLADKNQDIVTQSIIAAGAVGVAGVIFNFIGFQALTHHTAHLIARLRETVFQQLLHKDNSFFTNQKVGAMTGRYIDYVRSAMTINDLFVIRTVGFLLSLSAGITVLWLQSWLLACIVLIFIVLLMFQIRWSAKYRAPWRHERKELVSEIHGEVADSLTNNLIVRTFGGEDREMKSLLKMTHRFEKIFKKDIGFALGEGSVRVAFMVVIQVSTILVATKMVQDGSLSIATAVFTIAYLQRLGSQIFTLGEMINGYDQAFLDAQPMTEMLLYENAVKDKSNATALRDVSPTIELEHMSYRYDDGKENVLTDINLHIPSGQKVGLVGHSGAGKSTISQLLLRFADVTSGSIKLSGHDLRDITQDSLRENIAYVPQEPMLFHRSLRDNIAYGKPNASDAEILKAAKQANALDFINTLPEGLDTTVGERGVKLSGGQRQRIAIARAILKDAPILVLDEATSALDSESEKLIQDSLEMLMKNRTSIVIAHRLSTIAKLDRIIVLEKGAIIEDGTHAELLRQKGTYAKLWNHQSGGFIEE